MSEQPILPGDDRDADGAPPRLLSAFWRAIADGADRWRARTRWLTRPIARRTERLRARVASRRADLAILALALGCLWASVAIDAADRAERAALPRTVFSVAGSWTLLELERHIEAGDVLSIGAASGALIPEPACVSAPPAAFAPDGGCEDRTARRALDAGRGAVALDPDTETPALAYQVSSGLLLARTGDGQRVLVETGVGLPDAVASLRAAGYGRLLSQEALEAAVGQAAPQRRSSLPSLLTWLILFLIGWLVVRSLRRSGGIVALSLRNPGPLKAPEPLDEATRPTARLADVGGIEDAKLEVGEMVEFLRDPLRFARLGARVPRGLLLWGPPGTGKTLLARAIAGEASVPFFSASGSDFVEMYVGLGARRIRSLFAAARKAGAAVIFVDEIDALARKRTSGPNSNDEREQTLNAMLVEMDGFGGADGVIVVAATNRLDILDPAVLRPGRFTRKVHVGLPDRVARRQILAVHATGKPLEERIDLDALARRTAGMSGAQLADLLNEAAIFAARRDDALIRSDDLARAIVKVHAGASRTRSIDERERSILAVHEMGHAFVGRELRSKRRVERISLFAHGEALGITLYSAEDNALPSERDLRALIIASLAGRAAEDLFFADTTPGAARDFEHAREIAEAMVRRYGMGADPATTDASRGRLGLIVADESGRLPESLEPIAAGAVREILHECYAVARATILADLPRFWAAASALYEAEELDGDELDALVGEAVADDLTDPSVDWRSPDAHPRPWSELMEAHRAAATPPPAPR